MSCRRFVLSWLFALALLSGRLAAADTATALDAALSTITAGELQRFVDTLAGDTFEGREAGSRGGRAAAGYITHRLTELGLDPAGEDGSYFQAFGAGYRNILARIEGSDERLAREAILVGAHYDHVGYGSRSNSLGPIGYIHNGADDNASGTAALLEVAEALRRLPTPPRRTIVIAFWDGEEKGLLGSQHWTRSPTWPLDRLRGAINVDMVGRLRNQTVKVYGARTGFGQRRLVSEANVDGRLWVDFDGELKANSDHWPFFERGLPVLMFHTGLHDDYHRPSDNADKINAAGIEEVARLIFRTTVALADADATPRFRTASRGESSLAARQLAAPMDNPPPRLGVSWRRRDDGRWELTRIVPGSAAERAGLQAGDILLSLDGRPLDDEQRLKSDILAAPAAIVLRVARGGEAGEAEHDVAVELAGKPLRLGLSWREDAAEPGVLVLAMVAPGSSAAAAGVRVGDRLYTAQGRSFTGGDDFLAWFAQHEGPLELQLERNGRLLSFSLDTPAPRPLAAP